MKNRMLYSVVAALVALCTLSADQEAVPADTGEQTSPVPEERPRLDLPWNMHPYRVMPSRGLDPWYGWNYPYAGYYPYRWGSWSDLYYDTLYGYLPEPDHSELTVSVGSDDYFGTSISHTGYVDRKHGIAYNVAALWETGETYWTHRDYESFTVAPTFFWNNDDTSVYVGFAYTETQYDDDNMSPFRTDSREDEVAQSGRIRLYRPTDYTEKRASVGIEHQVNDLLKIGFHIQASDIDRKRTSAPGN